MKGQNSKHNQKKEDQLCEHCKETSHMKDSCIKLHGCPNWYKQLKKDKPKNGGRGYANMADNAGEDESTEGKKDITAK